MLALFEDAPPLSRRASLNYFKKETDKEEKFEVPAIYKYLSHHYVGRKSVVFIVDQKFHSDKYLSIVNSQVLHYFNQLNREDYFGYIQIGVKYGQEDLILE